MDNKIENLKKTVKTQKKQLKRLEVSETDMDWRTSGKVEKRTYRRVPTMVLEVKGKQFDKVFFAYTKEISEGGLSLETNTNIKIGERFPIELVLPDNQTIITCECEVIWQKQYDKDGVISKGMGVRFVNMDDKNKSTLQHILENSSEDTFDDNAKSPPDLLL